MNVGKPRVDRKEQKVLRRVTYIIGLVLCLSYLLGCQRLDDSSGSGPAGDKSAPDQESWDSKIILSDRGAITAVMRAGHISQFEKEHTAEIDSGLTVDFFGKEGRHVSTLTAERGSYNRKTQGMNAFGNVVVISDAKDTLQTDQLSWNNAQKKLLAEGPVRISNPQGTQTGIGLESSANLKDWKLKQVTGVYEGPLEWPEEP